MKNLLTFDAASSFRRCSGVKYDNSGIDANDQYSRMNAFYGSGDEPYKKAYGMHDVVGF